MPAWFENAKLYISPIDPDGADQRIYDLLLISRSVNKFMDTVHIEGDQTAMSIIEQTHKWFFEFCDWRLLQPKSGDFETLNIQPGRRKAQLGRSGSRWHGGDCYASNRGSVCSGLAATGHRAF
jgi:hypothetical protein